MRQAKQPGEREQDDVRCKLTLFGSCQILSWFWRVALAKQQIPLADAACASSIRAQVKSCVGKRLGDMTRWRKLLAKTCTRKGTNTVWGYQAIAIASVVPSDGSPLRGRTPWLL